MTKNNKCDTCDVIFFDMEDLHYVDTDDRTLCTACLEFEIEQMAKFGVNA
jgi:hypothetical protein